MLSPQPLRRPTSPWPQDLAQFSVRLGLGVVFMFHGAQKLFSWFGGHGLGKLIENYGVVVGTLVGIGEFFGGLGLLVGLLSRFSAASLILIMGGAIYFVHAKNGFASSDGGIEYNFVLITMCVAVLVAGPGRWALARILPDALRPWLE